MAIRESACGVIPVKKQGGRWMVYLIKHAAGHWGMPKGKKEENESIRDCAARELREETQLEIDRWFMARPYFEEYTFERAGELVEKDVTYCIASVKGTAQVDQKEVVDGAWFPLDEASRTLTHEQSKTLAAKVQHTLSLLERLGWLER